jgi:hypothetical protein
MLSIRAMQEGARITRLFVKAVIAIAKPCVNIHTAPSVLAPPRQVTFVPPGFTRKPPKYERFIRPTGLRMTKAHVTHPELKATFQLEIIGVKKNPNGQAYTGLGVVTKGALPGGGEVAEAVTAGFWGMGGML